MKLAVTFIAVFIAADVVISMTCKKKEDCHTIKGSYCYRNKCQCVTYTHLSRDGKKCIQNSVFYGRCDPREYTCHVNMKCRKDGICVCDEKHRYDWGMEARCLYEQEYKEICSKYTMVCGTYGSNMRCYKGVCECLKGFHYDNDLKRCRRCNIPVNIGDECGSEKRCCAKGSQCVQNKCTCGSDKIYITLEDSCVSDIQNVICDYFSQRHQITLPNKGISFHDGNRVKCVIRQVNVTLNKLTSPCRLTSPTVRGGTYRFKTDRETFITGNVNFIKQCTKDGRGEPTTNTAIALRVHHLKVIVFNNDKPTCPLVTLHLKYPDSPRKTVANQNALDEAKSFLEKKLQDMLVRYIYTSLENALIGRLDCMYRRPSQK